MSEAHDDLRLALEYQLRRGRRVAFEEFSEGCYATIEQVHVAPFGELGRGKGRGPLEALKVAAERAEARK